MLFKRFGLFKREVMTSLNEQHFSKSEVVDPQIASKDWRDPQMGCFNQKTPDCTKEERFIRYDANPHLYEFGSAPSRKMVQA